jgi:hypothetical protein
LGTPRIISELVRNWRLARMPVPNCRQIRGADWAVAPYTELSCAGNANLA